MCVWWNTLHAQNINLFQWEWLSETGATCICEISKKSRFVLTLKGRWVAKINMLRPPVLLRRRWVYLAAQYNKIIKCKSVYVSVCCEITKLQTMQLCNLNFFKSCYTFCPAKELCKRSVPGYNLICDVEHVQEKKVHSLRSKVKTIKSLQ